MATEARGIRLNTDLWTLVDEAAKEHRMTTSAYIALRLATLFDFEGDVHNSHARVAQKAQKRGGSVEVA